MLKVKCTQYGICNQAAFKNSKAMFFSKLGGAGNNFRSASKISLKGVPNPNLTPPKVCEEMFNVCALLATRSSGIKSQVYCV